MQRSISARNIAGAFLGGVLGVLAAGYFSWLATPFAAFLGVVLGWWFEDIIRLSVQTTQQAFYLQGSVGWFIRSQYRLLRLKLRPTIRVIMFLARCVRIVCSALLLPITRFGTFVQRVRSFWYWIKASFLWMIHPVNVALMLTVVACVVCYLTTTALIVATGAWLESGTLEVAYVTDPAPWVASGIVALVFTASGMMFVFDPDEENGQTRFYRRWSAFTQHGPLGYFWHQTFRTFKAAYISIILLAFAVVYWVTIGGLLLAVVIIPVTTFVSMMIGLYRIAERPAHWLCFGVTLVVTMLSVISFSGSFDNQTTLWLVALCTGAVSAICTEGLRRGASWWCQTETGMHYQMIWYDDKRTLAFSIIPETWAKVGRWFDSKVILPAPYVLK